MADYPQTASLVLASAAAVHLKLPPIVVSSVSSLVAPSPIAGATITAGMPVCPGSDGFYYPARAKLQSAQTSGSLVINRRYIITTFVAGDDFANVGGTNVTGNIFTATGTTPTTWTNASTLNDADQVYKVSGVADDSASRGQPISIVTYDPDFQPGCVLAVGDNIIVSQNDGKICEDAGKAATWFVSSLGVATSTSRMFLNITRADAVR